MGKEAVRGYGRKEIGAYRTEEAEPLSFLFLENLSSFDFSLL